MEHGVFFRTEVACGLRLACPSRGAKMNIQQSWERASLSCTNQQWLGAAPRTSWQMTTGRFGGPSKQSKSLYEALLMQQCMGCPSAFKLGARFDLGWASDAIASRKRLRAGRANGVGFHSLRWPTHGNGAPVELGLVRKSVPASALVLI